MSKVRRILGALKSALLAPKKVEVSLYIIDIEARKAGHDVFTHTSTHSPNTSSDTALYSETLKALSEFRSKETVGFRDTGTFADAIVGAAKGAFSAKRQDLANTFLNAAIDYNIGILYNSKASVLNHARIVAQVGHMIGIAGDIKKYASVINLFPNRHLDVCHAYAMAQLDTRSKLKDSFQEIFDNECRERLAHYGKASWTDRLRALIRESDQQKFVYGNHPC
jgi:hypothetical protein